MPKKPSNQRSEVDELRKRLEKNKATLAKIAKAAKISAKTLTDIKDPTKFEEEFASALTKFNEGKRNRLAGLAASVTRLAIYLDLQPKDILLGLSFPVDDPVINRASERAKSTAKRSQVVDDPTMAIIRGRAVGPDNASGVVQVAVLDWRPFYDEGDGNFAKLYMRSLLGAVDPKWRLDYYVEDSISDTMYSVIESQKYDLVFGLYALPFRRSRGLIFVPVPGIRVPLGAIVAEGSRLNWPEIISPTATSDFRAIVLENEAGYHFLAGACAYPDHSLKILEDHQTNDIALALAKTLEEEKMSRVFFVADRFTCEDVVAELSKWRAGRDLPSALGSIPVPSIHLLEETAGVRVPSYPLSVGLRADSTFFGELLRDATQTDLFYNAALHTAGLYFDLLRKPESRSLHVDPSQFHQLGEDIRHRFLSAYLFTFEHKLPREGDRKPSPGKPGYPAYQLYEAAKHSHESDLENAKHTEELHTEDEL